MAEIGFKKCYFLAPTRYYAPEKRIKLGNIISSPTAPDEPLNDLPFTIDVVNIEEHNETNWSVSRGKSNEVKLSLWASFLQFILGIGGDVGGGQKSDSSQILRCEKVTTREFNPSRAFVQDCIQDTGVKEYLVENRYQYVFGGHSSKKLYMVTGVKIASGASLVVEVARQRNIHLHLGVDGTPAGVPASGGPEVQVTSGRTEGESFDSADVFVLGFRLRQIKVGPKGDFSQKQFTDGSTLGIEGDKEAEQIEITVDEFPEGDTRGTDVGKNEYVVIDENGGDECLCVNPT